jgi:hypothetical protein
MGALFKALGSLPEKCHLCPRTPVTYVPGLYNAGVPGEGQREGRLYAIALPPLLTDAQGNSNLGEKP